MLTAPIVLAAAPGFKLLAMPFECFAMLIFHGILFYGKIAARLAARFAGHQLRQLSVQLKLPIGIEYPVGALVGAIVATLTYSVGTGVAAGILAALFVVVLTGGATRRSEHTIFVLDDSSSMSGKPFADMRAAYTSYFTERESLGSSSHPNDRCTVIMFSSQVNSSRTYTMDRR
jgi:hypothetical protein